MQVAQYVRKPSSAQLVRLAPYRHTLLAVLVVLLLLQLVPFSHRQLQLIEIPARLLNLLRIGFVGYHFLTEIERSVVAHANVVVPCA